MKGATVKAEDFNPAYAVSTRAPVKGATWLSESLSNCCPVSTRAPVKGATDDYDGKQIIDQIVSTRAPVKGATLPRLA